MIHVRSPGRPDANLETVLPAMPLRTLAGLLNTEVGPGWEIHAVPRRPRRFAQRRRA